MTWWTELRLYFYRKALDERLRARRVRARSLPFAQTKRVALLFDATELDQREEVRRYADQWRKRGKEVRLLGLLRDQPGQPDLGFPNFGTKDLDWRYLPKTQVVPDFLAQSFDVLINLDRQHHRALEYVTALADAPFRVGAVCDDPTHYELLIDAPGNSLTAFWKQVQHYLPLTNTPHAGIT